MNNDGTVNVSLAQYLLSKLCHDLSGALGAVSNGIEFINSDNTKDQAIALLQHGSKQAVTILEFFRKAYGAYTAQGEANLEEIERLCTKFASMHKLTLDFYSEYTHRPDIFICRNTGRLILCLVAIAIESLIYGGVVTVKFLKTDIGKKIVVIASHNKLKHNHEKNRILCNKLDHANLNHSNVHYHYTAIVAKQLGAVISINEADGIVEYVVE